MLLEEVAVPRFRKRSNHRLCVLGILEDDCYCRAVVLNLLERRLPPLEIDVLEHQREDFVGVHVAAHVIPLLRPLPSDLRCDVVFHATTRLHGRVTFVSDFLAELLYRHYP